MKPMRELLAGFDRRRLLPLLGPLLLIAMWQLMISAQWPMSGYGG